MGSPRIATTLVFAAVLLLGPGAARPALAALDDLIFASDFLSGSGLQWIRRHPDAGTTTTIGPVLVTAVRAGGNQNLTFYVQVPPGLNTEAGYPAYSGLKIFIQNSGFIPAVGDCIYVGGTVLSFRGAAELANGAVVQTAAGDCGGSPVVAYSISLVSIATDTDKFTADNQPGTQAEALESVLVALDNFAYVTQGNNGSGSFTVANGAPVHSGAVNEPDLVVGNFLYQYSAVQGTPLQLVGILDQSNPVSPPPSNLYQLLPRSASDVTEIF